MSKSNAVVLVCQIYHVSKLAVALYTFIIAHYTVNVNRLMLTTYKNVRVNLC